MHSPSIRYGTALKSAVVDKNATRRLPESMSDPRVGQPLAANDAEVGAYASVSSPAALKTVSYSDGATLSELTIRRDTTKNVAQSAVAPTSSPRFTLTVVGVGVHPCLHCNALSALTAMAS